ncbi:hypothetical protein HCH_04795 [Hahella chejuensis KCTC 2396]|uniref:Outer membrane protein beta-barrel domain-containing protein n=1 Tax=Hahella chejuensis (strain KCTC 2396) TaxID=349521 RepID=Q2SCY5_HAHCH|nr:hypothetical protein [Hahella chejuensis]ABC31489.1 hypothetical protein HCH_04795 [Hahella chejuensis KCTC 2396]
MKSFVVNALAVAALSVSCMSVQAEEIQDSRSLYFALTGGMTFGGDELVQVDDVGGLDDIRAGGLFNMGLGAYWQSASQPVAAQVTLNYQFDYADAKNADATFDRMPIEAVVYYTGVDKWRFGAGVRYIASPEVEIEGGGSKLTAELDPSIGFVVEAGYFISSNVILNVRGVAEKYEVDSVNVNGYRFDSIEGAKKEFSGNHIGFNVVALF